MPWENERFERLEQRIIGTLEKGRAVLDVPYFLYLYDPTLELIALEEFRKLVARLQTKGYSTEMISLSQWMIDALEKLGCLQDWFSEKDMEPVKKDLERELPEELSRWLIEHLKERDISHCSVLIRTGALFPFVHVSTLLSRIEGYVKSTLVIAYPGNQVGEMLNYPGWKGNWYRVEVF